jgi:hypothetical protein
LAGPFSNPLDVRIITVEYESWRREGFPDDATTARTVAELSRVSGRDIAEAGRGSDRADHGGLRAEYEVTDDQWFLKALISATGNLRARSAVNPKPYWTGIADLRE